MEKENPVVEIKMELFDMKKVLILAESLRINGTSSGIVSSTFIKMLVKGGYQLKVITPNNFEYPVTWLDDVEVIKFKIPEVKKSIIDRIPKIRAIYSYFVGYDKEFKCLIDSWKCLIADEVKNNHYDYILVLGSGSEFSPHIALSQLDINIPWIANFHDPFPWHVYPEPYRKKRNLIGFHLEVKTKKIIEKAWKVSFPSLYLMEHMSRFYPEIAKKYIIIPHIGTNLDDLPAIDSDNDLNLDLSKINIVHAGSLLGPRNPKFLIEAIIDLQQNGLIDPEKVNFTFIGKIARELTDTCKKLKMNNVLFFNGRVSYKRSIEIINQSDALLVIEAISDFSPFLPGKVADIAFAGKPIIALSPNRSEVKRILGSNFPYHAHLDSITEIKDVLKTFINDFDNNTIDLSYIDRIKNYVSVEENCRQLTKIFI